MQAGAAYPPSCTSMASMQSPSSKLRLSGVSTGRIFLPSARNLQEEGQPGRERVLQAAIARGEGCVSHVEWYMSHDCGTRAGAGARCAWIMMVEQHLTERGSTPFLLIHSSMSCIASVRSKREEQGRGGDAPGMKRDEGSVPSSIETFS